MGWHVFSAMADIDADPDLSTRHEETLGKEPVAAEGDEAVAHGMCESEKP